jgi:hypothetical protein
MPAPRLPQEVAQLTGAVAKNAGRFKGRSTPKVKSLGSCPKRFTDDQKAIWNEFNADFPWLGRSDRALVETATSLLHQMRLLGDKTPIALYAQMRMILAQMGGTPVDRSKVSEPEEDPEDPANEFIN